jgi:hypothetical protein
MLNRNDSSTMHHFLLAMQHSHPASYPMGTEDLSPGVKQLGHEAGHSHPVLKSRMSHVFTE